MIPQLSSVYISISLVLCGLSASAQDPAWHFESTAGKPSKLVWQTESGKSYDLWQATDLTDWKHVEGFPQVGTGAEMSFSFTAGSQGFFRFSKAISDGEFVLIPAGIFQMGDPTGVGDRLEILHSVDVSDFHIGKYEVTKELWDEVRVWGASNGYTDLSTGNGPYASKGANHPVHSITWYNMVKWCNARSEKAGLTPCYTIDGATYKMDSIDPAYFTVDCNWIASGYRLPSEAEWEKAARGGLSGKNFPWGNTITHSQANYTVYSDNGTTNFYSYDVTPRPGYLVSTFYHPTYAVGGYPYTSPVGSFAPNGYGLYDMVGNLIERCWDLHGSYSAMPQTDPHGPPSGAPFRLLRGGGWGYVAGGCRVAFRGYDLATISSNGIGFRLARSSSPEEAARSGK